MKCPVCKKNLNRKKQHRYEMVDTKYDGVLGINRIGAGNNKYMRRRLMHVECARAYKAAEKIMISAGLLKPKLEFLKFNRDEEKQIRFIKPDGVIVGNNATFMIMDDTEASTQVSIGGKW